MSLLRNLHMALLMGTAPFTLAAMVAHARTPSVKPAKDVAEDIENESEPLGVITLSESLEDVEKPEEVRAGVYTAEVQDVQIPTSQKGNEYFSVKFVIPPEELPADQRDQYPDGAIMYWNRTVVPNGNDRRALWNTKKLVQALGLPTNTSTIDPNEWMGRRARVRVKMGSYQGEDRAEISAVEAAEAAPSRTTAAKGGTRRGR